MPPDLPPSGRMASHTLLTAAGQPQRPMARGSIVAARETYKPSRHHAPPHTPHHHHHHHHSSAAGTFKQQTKQHSRSGHVLRSRGAVTCLEEVVGDMRAAHNARDVEK